MSNSQSSGPEKQDNYTSVCEAQIRNHRRSSSTIAVTALVRFNVIVSIPTLNSKALTSIAFLMLKQLNFVFKSIVSVVKCLV